MPAHAAAIASRAEGPGGAIRAARPSLSRSTTMPVATAATSSSVTPVGSGVPAAGAQQACGQS